MSQAERQTRQRDKLVMKMVWIVELVMKMMVASTKSKYRVGAISEQNIFLSVVVYLKRNILAFYNAKRKELAQH